MSKTKTTKKTATKKPAAKTAAPRTSAPKITDAQRASMNTIAATLAKAGPFSTGAFVTAIAEVAVGSKAQVRGILSSLVASGALKSEGNTKARRYSAADAGK